MHWEAKNLCLTVLQYSLCCGGLPCPQYPWGMPVLVVAIGGLRVCTISYTWDWPQFGEEVPHLEELRPTVTLSRQLSLHLLQGTLHAITSSVPPHWLAVKWRTIYWPYNLINISTTDSGDCSQISWICLCPFSIIPVANCHTTRWLKTTENVSLVVLKT